MFGTRVLRLEDAWKTFGCGGLVMPRRKSGESVGASQMVHSLMVTLPFADEKRGGGVNYTRYSGDPRSPL